MPETFVSKMNKATKPQKQPFLWPLLAYVFFLAPLAFGLTREEFSIQNGVKETIYTAEQLRARKDAIELSIPLLNYPDTKLTVTAIPVSNLLQESGVRPEHFILYRALDGYSGVLELSSLQANHPSQARAYLAIEGQDPWPPLPKTSNTEGKSAGPFYLIWQNPQLSDIPPEYWPYQLKSLRFETNLQTIYPLIYPKSKNQQVAAGFLVFKTRCMSCHSINYQGTSRLGPDLNQPMNPVEYFQPEALAKFLQNPASVRNWRSMKMTWIKGNHLSATDAQNVIKYLEDMAKNRPQNP